MAETKEAFLARRKAAQAKEFAEMLGRPEVKLMVSMVPATQPPELLQTLLSMFFDAGIAHGVAGVITETLDTLRKDRP